MGHLYLFPSIQDSGTIGKREVRKNAIARGWVGKLWNTDFWKLRICWTHQLKAAVVACTSLAKNQASQNSSVDWRGLSRPHCSGEAVGSWWLQRESRFSLGIWMLISSCSVHGNMPSAWHMWSVLIWLRGWWWWWWWWWCWMKESMKLERRWDKVSWISWGKVGGMDMIKIYFIMY